MIEFPHSKMKNLQFFVFPVTTMTHRDKIVHQDKRPTKTTISHNNFCFF